MFCKRLLYTHNTQRQYCLDGKQKKHGLQSLGILEKLHIIFLKAFKGHFWQHSRKVSCMISKCWNSGTNNIILGLILKNIDLLDFVSEIIAIPNIVHVWLKPRCRTSIVE